MHTVFTWKNKKAANVEYERDGLQIKLLYGYMRLDLSLEILVVYIGSSGI